MLYQEEMPEIVVLGYYLIAMAVDNDHAYIQ
jgi:hypothetical protein